MYSKNRIGNRNALLKLSIVVFQISSISLIESEEFWETSNLFHSQLIISSRLKHKLDKYVRYVNIVIVVLLAKTSSGGSGRFSERVARVYLINLVVKRVQTH